MNNIPFILYPTLDDINVNVAKIAIEIIHMFPFVKFLCLLWCETNIKIIDGIFWLFLFQLQYSPDQELLKD